MGYAGRPEHGEGLNQKIYAQIETWRNRPIQGNHPYVFLDGLWLKRSWGGEVRNVSLLVAIGVSEVGYREVLVVAEGSKEDKTSWTAFCGIRKNVGSRASGCLFPTSVWVGWKVWESFIRKRCGSGAFLSERVDCSCRRARSKKLPPC